MLRISRRKSLTSSNPGPARTEMTPGTVYLVGAGPGDPGLLTIAARAAIAAADVVYYDALAPEAALQFARPNAILHDVGKRGGDIQPAQDGIAAAVIRDADLGRTIVRLKGGDPFVFGRGGEEAEACRAAGIPFVVIPGITSAVAGPAYAGIPVTYRGLARSFAVVTGATHDDSPIDWSGFSAVDTLVVLMGARNVQSISSGLIAGGRSPDTPAAVVQWATTPKQRSVHATLATIAVRAATLGSPAVLVVGDTAALAETLAWYAPPPLAGRSVVVTMSHAVAGPYVTALRTRGADVSEIPLIDVSICPAQPLLTALRSHAGWLLLPGRNAVRALSAALAAGNLDARALAQQRIAVAGPGTADELSRLGLRADFQPDNPGAAALGADLPLDWSRDVLILQSSRAGSALASRLSSRGAEATVVEAYRNEPAPLSSGQVETLRTADAIVLASPSAVDSLSAALNEVSAQLVAIGPTTAAAARSLCGRIDAVAHMPAPGPLADAVERALQ